MHRKHPFLWGAATSSHQIEGGNDKNDWWHWEHQGNVEGGVKSGAATDHFNKFRDDIRLAADLGLNTYRLSIEWSRVEPAEGTYSSEGMGFYRDVIAECERHGLVPMLTLHHFTSPQWLAEKGGWADPCAPEHFAGFTRTVVRELGSRIPLWCTLNEPLVMVSGGYLGKFMPPAIVSPSKASMALHNLLRAHVAAYDIIHSEIRGREGPWASWPIQVGIAHNMVDFQPHRFWNPLEQLMSRILWRFYNRAWLDAVTGRTQHFGVRGLMPYAPVVREALGRRTCEYIGVNYYTKGYVKVQASKIPIDVSFARNSERSSDLGWAIHPSGFAKILRTAGSYGLPVYVTENGIADQADAHRSDYLVSHLSEIAHLVKQGLDIRGYYHWSLMDNFEWSKGFWPRFGLYEVDYKTFERKLRPSGKLFRDIIQRHSREHAPHMDWLTEFLGRLTGGPKVDKSPDSREAA